MRFLEKYYPIILAFLSFLYSVFLWFSGNKLEGIFVGINSLGQAEIKFNNEILEYNNPIFLI